MYSRQINSVQQTKGVFSRVLYTYLCLLEVGMLHIRGVVFQYYNIYVCMWNFEMEWGWSSGFSKFNKEGKGLLKKGGLK